MQDVISTVERQMDGTAGELAFTELAKRWASYCLENHQDELLDKGLNIAKALVAYEDELH